MAAPHAAAEDIRDGEQLFNTGEYAKCAEMATGEIDRGNYLEQWRVLKVKSLMAVGDYAGALAAVDSALLEFNSSLPLRLLANSVAHFNGQPARAASELSIIERLAASDPQRFSSPANRVALGRYFLRIGADARQVLEIFYDPVVKSWPDYLDAHLASAELSLDKYDNKLAAETLKKAPDAASENVEYHYLLARAYSQDDGEAADKELTAALAINPRHVKALLLRADQLVDAEHYDDAAKVLDDVIAVNPHEPIAWAYKAVLANLASDAEGEKSAREKALTDWADDPEVDWTIGRKLSDKYRFAEGAAYQRQALAFDATYLPAQMQLSQDLLRLGQEDEGWQLASTVFNADGYNVVAHNLVTLHDTVKNYKILTNDSFRVRMEAREAAIYGDRVLELLDRAKATLCKKYDSPLDHRIAIEIFPQQKDFAVRTFGLPGAAGFLGVCFGNVITANSPAALGQTSANWESVLWHEFCHAVTLGKSHNKMPRWLSEGISVFEERQQDPRWGQAMTPDYRALIASGKMPPVSELSGSFLAPESPMALQFAYFESALVVEYIVEKYGQDALKQVLADLGAGVGIEDALARNVAPLNRLDAEFDAFARKKADELAPKLSWDSFDLPPDATSDDVAAWLKEHPDNYSALVRWGRMLQREKKWKESLEPAQRLRELYPTDVGGGNAYALLMRAHRELGDADAEREALEAWASLAPDVPEVYDRLAEIAAAAGDWKAVELNSRRELAVNPLTPAPHRWLAAAADHLNQPDDAISAYRALLEFDTTDPVDAHYKLARLLHVRGDESDAKRQVLMALEDAPRFRDAHRLLLELVAKESKTKPATAPAPTGATAVETSGEHAEETP